MKSNFNILITNSSNIYAGGEFYVFELAKTLRKRNHNVLVACRPDNLLVEKCRQSGVTVVPVDFPPKGKLGKFVGILRQLIREYRIDIVHTNANYDRTAGAFSAKLEKKIHIANIHSFHSIQHNLTHWVRNRWATDHFLAVGACVKDLLVRQDRIASSAISVVRLGVDPDTMYRDANLRKKVRSEFGYTDSHVVIGNVGRLVPFKGQEYLLRAFAEVSSQYPDARLLIAGDGVLLDKLLGLSKQLGIDRFVHFAGFRDDMQAVYSAFDIYCHSSVEHGGEACPVAVLQALSQELPLVVTKVGDVAEMVQEGRNGFGVEDKNSSILADKLKYLLNDKEKIVSMGAASRRYLLQRFTIAIMVDNVESVYQSIASKNA